MKKETVSDNQSRGSATLHDATGTAPAGVTISSWRDWDTIARKEHAREMQRLVDRIFREQVMGVLALLLVPILLLLDFAHLPEPVAAFLTIIDIGIWIFFVLEYIFRLVVANDRYAYIVSPWHIIDVLIVGIPAVALVSGTGYGIARYFRVLRAMQSVQVLYIAAKQAHRQFAEKQLPEDTHGLASPMKVRSIPVIIQGMKNSIPTPTPAWSVVTVDESTVLDFRGHWFDFSGYNNADLPALSRLTRIPQYQLEVKLRERAYPRADVSGPVTTVFLKVPRVRQEQSDPPAWEITWDGLLVAYDRDSVLTFSRYQTDITDRVMSDGSSEEITHNGPGILYFLVNISLSTIEDLVLTAEEQLIYLETQSMDRLPGNFLSMMYTDQKELSRIISGLLYTKTALEEVCTSDRVVFNRDEAEESRLRALADRCSQLSDNAQHVADSFAWMVDFYLNTASFSMNRVMKLLAVLTALTMVPALVGGLLGMNLIDNPWPATLLQMVSVVALVMLVTAWVYYNIGWLRE
ncbi:MAG: ion transporter [Methanomicrobiales archaeon]|nr:ion transporter [Methanomicrobiales archaeon]